MQMLVTKCVQKFGIEGEKNGVRVEKKGEMVGRMTGRCVAREKGGGEGEED